MDVEAIKQLRLLLEAKIHYELGIFQQDTGLLVTAVDLVRIETFGREARIETVKVQLEIPRGDATVRSHGVVDR